MEILINQSILFLMKNYLYKNKIEYIDFLNYGFEKLLENIGLIKKN